VPGAASYVFSLDRGDPVRVDAPYYQLPQDDLPAPGDHFWYVVAIDAQDAIVGAFPALAEFHVPAAAGD
jgi:hypothetical protein